MKKNGSCSSNNHGLLGKKALYLAGMCYLFVFFAGCGSGLYVLFLGDQPNGPPQNTTCTDSTPPAPGSSGNFTIMAVSESSLTLTWIKASDNVTAQASLQYKVVKADGPTLNTLSGAQSGETEMNWTADVSRADLYGLVPGNLYYFNILVKDECNNTAIYTMAPVNMAADGTFTFSAVEASGSGNNMNSTKSANRPVFAVMDDTLYMSWNEARPDGISQIRVRSYDGSVWKWTDGGNVNAGINSNASCSGLFANLTVDNSKLYAAWSEYDPSLIYQVRVKEYNGTSWAWADGGGAEGINVSTSVSGYAPQLAVYGGTLYCAWTEGSSPSLIRVKRWDGGATWTLVDGGGLNYNATKTGSEVRITSFGSSLVAIWRENSSTVYPSAYQIKVKSYNGSSWSWIDGGDSNGSGINYRKGSTTDRPNLAVFAYQGTDYLYATWVENRTSIGDRVRVAKYGGNGTWSEYVEIAASANEGLNISNNQNGTVPQLYQYGGNLYATWTEPTGGAINQIRLRRYDNSPDSWNWTDGGASTGLNVNTARNAEFSQLIEFHTRFYCIWQEDSGGSIYNIRMKRYP